MNIDLRQGDCLEVLKTIPDNSVDSVVTDPPYHLTSIVKRFGKEGSAPAQFGTDGAYARASKGFMGKEWDGGDIAFRTDVWSECLRVLKPGGHLLSFSHSRTYHRMAVAIEDAGFEIRDSIMWIYGSGFPKSHNIGKAVDKIEGNQREIGKSKGTFVSSGGQLNGENTRTERFESKGNSDYEGWGTALKPAHEPICMARKPLSEKSIAENVLKWGTGGINIDGCRIEIGEGDRTSAGHRTCNIFETEKISGGNGSPDYETHEGGRFPANIMFDDDTDVDWKRYFYCPKTSKKERNNGLIGKVEIFTPTIKLVYLLENNVWEKEDLKTKLVDTDKSLQKVIDASIIMEDNKWNIESFGNYIMEQFQKEHKSITETEINSTTIYQTLNLWIQNHTRTYIAELFGEKVKDIKFVENVEQKSTTLNITIQNKDGYSPSVKNVELIGLWNINIVPSKSSHPTVKPIKLMEYLITLVTPKGGVVMDCFMGSGSTGIAAKNLGFSFIGIEREQEYFDIAEQRIGL